MRKIILISNKLSFSNKNTSILIKQFNVKFKSTAFNYPTKRMEICALKNYYKEKPNGLKLDVEYCDTKDYVDHDAPVVLAIHGSPGTHLDFEPYVEKLYKRFGVRFIAPNLPPFETIDRYPMYLHKVEEKAIFLNDLLNQLNINKIDMLIAHSSGIYPPLYLWNTLNNLPNNRLRKINSFVFFNTPGDTTIKSLRPRWITKPLGDLSSTVLGRLILRSIGLKILRLVSIQNKLNKIDDLLMPCLTMNHAKEHLLKGHFQLICEKNLPVFFVFSKNDAAIELEVFMRGLKLLNSDKEDLVVYDEKMNLTKSGDLSKIINAIVFEKGGHYCFLKYNQIIGNYLINFIEEKACFRSSTGTSTAKVIS